MQSKNQFKVLLMLKQRKATNEIRAYTLKQCVERSGLHINTVRKCLKYLIEKKYVKEGAYKHKAKSYYVTEIGLSKVEELSS